MEKSNKMLIFGLIICLSVVGVLLMISKKSMTQQADTMQEENQLTVDSSTMLNLEDDLQVDTNTVKTFTLDSSEFKYDIPEIKVKVGDTVKITLTNSGKMPHDWKVDEFNAATKIIKNGEEDTIEFVVDKAGTYEFYCSVGQHRANGMVGTLIVE